MSNTYKALSALLSYPTQEIKDAAAEIRRAIHDEKLTPAWALRQLAGPAAAGDYGCTSRCCLW